jgi:hypothetical protein
MPLFERGECAPGDPITVRTIKGPARDSNEGGEREREKEVERPYLCTMKEAALGRRLAISAEVSVHCKLVE